MLELSDCKINLEHKFAPEERSSPMHEEYIQKIIELLPKCKDLSLLDLIYQLLKKRSERS